MTQLPVWSGRRVDQAFVRLGWVVARQRGSHIILVKAAHPARLSDPDHPEIARGTLRTLIRRAGVTVEEFVSADG